MVGNYYHLVLSRNLVLVVTENIYRVKKKKKKRYKKRDLFVRYRSSKTRFMLLVAFIPIEANCRASIGMNFLKGSMLFHIAESWLDKYSLSSVLIEIQIAR